MTPSHKTKKIVILDLLCFFFSSRRRHTRFKCDWSSDVCSSDLSRAPRRQAAQLEIRTPVRLRPCSTRRLDAWMSIVGLGLAFLAGVLSILSPCVLPLLPIVLGAAGSEHRVGPVALAGGVSLSFIAIGLFVATIGFALGYDAGWFWGIAAVRLILIGAGLLVPPLQVVVAV